MKRTLFQISLIVALLSMAGVVSAQMWAVRGVTRVYYGLNTDQPLPADYSGDGATEVAIFRSYYGLWSIQGLTRVYLGKSGDEAVPADFSGDLSADPSIFRDDTGLWVMSGAGRDYFGQAGDVPLSARGRGDYDGDGTADVAIFRSSSGLWAIRDITRVYWGSGEEPVPGDYDGDGITDIAYFQDSIGKWAVRDITTIWWGTTSDDALPGDYDSDGLTDAAVFRSSSGLWAIRNITRTYFGAASDTAVPGDYNGDGTDDIGIFRALTTPTPVPTPTPDSVIAQIQQGYLTGTQTVTGIVSLVCPLIYPPYGHDDPYYMNFYIADADAAYHGIYVYNCDWGPRIGDSVTLTGTVGDHNGKTQIENVSSFTVNSSGNTPYGPLSVTAAQVAEAQYEGCLVEVENARVTNENYGAGKWQVDIADGTVTLDDELDYNYFPLNGDQFASLIGIVERSTTKSPNQWLQPRFTADLDAADTILPHYALHGTVVTMDASHNVYDSYYIEVKGDLIEGVTVAAPSGVDVIDIDGLIFPALINSHDHPNKGAWDYIPLPNLGHYRCLSDWTKEPMYWNDFKAQAEGMYPGFTASYPLTKLTEVREATSGCAVIQGQAKSSAHYHDESSKLGVGIINGARFPGRILNLVFAASEGSAYWAKRHQDAIKGKLDRYIIHLAQSLTEASGGCEWREWDDQWSQWDSFDGYDTIIHGNSLHGSDFAEWSHPNGRQTVLSWVCKCNVLYYGNVADIPAALEHDAIVCIGTDATPWGMPNLLAELNYCKYISDQSGWSIQTREFIDMVIPNGAISFSQLDRMGTIEEGKLANFMVIDDGPGDPYDDLLMVAGGGAAYDYKCGPKDVRLTVVAGRPIYGDADLLNTTNFPFLYAPYIEDLTICGEAKKVTVARHNPSGISGVDDLFWDFYSEIWEKYQEKQYPCSFVSIDPAGVLPPTPVVASPTPSSSPTPEGYKTPSPTATPPPTATPTITPEGYKTPTPTPTPYADNLLENSGFETWTTSTQPEDWPDGSQGDAVYQEETGTVHGGTSSLKLTTTTAPGTFGDGIYQEVSSALLAEGSNYTFSAWVWSEETGSMGISGSWWTGTPDYWDTVKTTVAGQWTQLTVQSTAPTGVQNARCFIRGFTDTAPCGYADDADFRITP